MVDFVGNRDDRVSSNELIKLRNTYQGKMSEVAAELRKESRRSSGLNFPNKKSNEQILLNVADLEGSFKRGKVYEKNRRCFSFRFISIIHSKLFKFVAGSGSPPAYI